MNETSTAQWFCIKSKPRQEAVAAKQLQNLGEVEIVFPRVRRTRRGHEKNQVVVEPLFPGYLFIKFMPEDYHGSVRSTRGVLHLVSKNGQAVAVDPKVITELQALGPEGILSLLDAELKLGSKIKVIRGIFAGSEGEVVKLANPQKRIAVLMSLLGSEQAVELSSEDVAPLDQERN
jgi:transcriptional antiterminator RfaH